MNWQVMIASQRVVVNYQYICNLENTIFWMLCHVALVRSDILEECIASIIRVARIGEYISVASYC
jgi:hypothetical protein